MILLYIFISYMIMLGMMLEAYDGKTIPAIAWICFILSPFLFPVFIGMFLSEISKKDE